MLERILNKKVVVSYSISYSDVWKTYEGVVVECNDDFIVFDDGYMIAIKFIATINPK